LGQVGLEFVRQLLQTERVERVYATYRNPQSELLAITEPRLLPLDITEEAQIATVMKEIQTETAALHYIINCVACCTKERCNRKEFAATQCRTTAALFSGE